MIRINKHQGFLNMSGDACPTQISDTVFKRLECASRMDTSEVAVLQLF